MSAAQDGSKHAQVGLMRAAAKELTSRRILVNTIHPGPTATTKPSASTCKPCSTTSASLQDSRRIDNILSIAPRQASGAR
jgi:NAD(P)-dependent dehydrogenase (short-subunit alcohol dehydrogenase family)